LNIVVITTEYGLFKEKLDRKWLEFLNVNASNLYKRFTFVRKTINLHLLEVTSQQWQYAAVFQIMYPSVYRDLHHNCDCHYT